MNEIKILVIDDEIGIREGCKRALTPHGYTVQIAENGDKGLEIIRDDAIDLALIDVMMPGTSGIDLISLIHQHDPEIVCIIITGYATVELAVTTIKQGAYDFLTKPFTTDDLLLVVNQGVERRRLSLEAKRLQAVEAAAQRLEEEKSRLEELDRAKVAFIRLLTHELQAPISAITTYLQLILNEYIPPEQQKIYLERSLERAKEQLALISDLLEFGRLKEVKTELKPGVTQVDAALKAVLQQLEPQVGKKRIKISTELSPGSFHANMTTDHARSLWSNLIANAIKYTGDDGFITIQLRQDQSSILGSVQDNGIGIPEDAMENLFKEFFRARNAKDMNIPGTGLGLAIVKQIVEKAGGTISVDSKIDKGSKFSFVIPISE
jgi:signal transduction histidine kinase